MCDVVKIVGYWDLSRVSLALPPSTAALIKTTNLCTVNKNEDYIDQDSAKGDFNLRKAYNLASKVPHDSGTQGILNGYGTLILVLGFSSFFGKVTIIVCLLGIPLHPMV